jgi:hypothetical protein
LTSIAAELLLVRWARQRIVDNRFVRYTRANVAIGSGRNSRRAAICGVHSRRTCVRRMPTAESANDAFTLGTGPRWPASLSDE